MIFVCSDIKKGQHFGMSAGFFHFLFVFSIFPFYLIYEPGKKNIKKTAKERKKNGKGITGSSSKENKCSQGRA